ncbi:TetR/AcrR family transcriptional regulator [Baekduia sp. Peel2402]|uniref:TetR/AcrR family transcriptional regulator n=1 Tax=Baekduia sp. Peel2402 TaxID=3458296 RepID=UPI00403EA742
MHEARGLGARAEEVLHAARELLEEQGHDGLRMRLLADKLGIKAPTLYAHFRNKAAVENALIAVGLLEQSDAAAAALDGTPPEDDIETMWAAYRAWALRNPALHLLIASRALDRDDPAVREAERPGAEMVLRSARGDVNAAIAFWAFAYGLIGLELNDRVPPGYSLDDAWATGLRGLATTLPPRS